MFSTIAPTAHTGRRPAVGTRRFGLIDLVGLYRQRTALAQLTPEQLEDIGVSASEAALESARPVWDVPRHWLR